MNVLILDDNELFRNHLQSLLEKQGIQSIKSIDRVEDFYFLLSVESFDLLIIDCLLPGDCSGVDLVQKLKKTTHQSIWLTSGVIQQQAVDVKILSEKVDFFLRKPITESQLQSGLSQIKSTHVQKNVEDGVLSFFYHKDVLESHIQSFVHQQSVLKNYEIATLISLCIDTSFCGQMILKNNKDSNDIVTLTFSNGYLCRVQASHKKSYFGVLLAVHKFASVSDIKKILKIKDQQRIGERLIQNGYLSPHNLSFILEEQSKIRLSELMDSCLQFTAQLHPQIHLSKEENVMGSKKVHQVLLSILKSKLSQDWYDEFFSTKSDFILIRRKSLSSEEINWNRCLKEAFNHIDGVKNIKQIEDLLCKASFNKSEVRFCIYGLILGRWVYFQNNQNNQQYRKIDKIHQMIKRIKTEDYFSILSLPKDAHSTDIKERILNMIQVFHPDRGEILSSQLKAMCNEIMLELNKMKQILTNSVERKKYTRQMEAKLSSDVDNTMNVYDAYHTAKTQLQKSVNFNQSLSLLKDIQEQTQLIKDVKLYYFWALLKSDDAKDVDVDAIRSELERIPIELKYSYLYYFVKALCSIHSMDYQVGLDYLERCIVIEEGFLPAQIEKIKLNQILKKTKSIKSFFKVG